MDANGYIYAFDNVSPLGSLARSIMLRARQSPNQLLVSAFTVSEVLVKPVQLGQEFKAASARLFFRSSHVIAVPYDDRAISIFVRLRAFHRVKPLDALHLACAASAGTDLFLTNDAALVRLQVPGIGRIAPLTTEF